MVQLIVGVKGAGKTKKMLDHVHDSIKNVDGNIVYLDKSSQNMHELDNKVRLINVSEYPIQNTDPVSYTHLDVYKRQYWKRRVRRRRNPERTCI